MNLRSKRMAAAVALLYVLCAFLPNFSLFSIHVSAEDAKIVPVIDYENELIVLEGGDGSGVVKYMYSPNVSPGDLAAKKQAAEKWYPVYGDSVDISKYIPRSGEIMFAFREADELPNSDGVYSSRVTSEFIKCRPESITQTYLKNNVKYDTKKETVEITGVLVDGYDYKVGIGVWVKGQTEPAIDVNSKYNPLGGTVIVRKSATSSEFASIEYKVKITKAPAAPKVKVNEKTNKLIGITVKDYQWSTSEDGEYSAFPDKTIDLSEFESQMRVTVNDFETEIINGAAKIESVPASTEGGANYSGDTGEEYIVLYVKIPATDKKPSSPVQKLLIKKSLIEQNLDDAGV